MDSNETNGHSPTDIITYIGVPLAVLGVLPILYNTAATLAALSRIKRMLKHSRLTALTRSDVVNRIIEVELPRYAVRPMDRFSDRAEYWTLSRHPSSIPGGSWTTFNWRTNVIGLNTQRVEYADQLRQPQVEVEFDQLVCYLLDLGAVPDKHGWRMLRSSGLWTPVGCTLMLSPDGREKALSIGPLEGSDGHLSLAVSWTGDWTTRDYSHLPPYWVRFPPPPQMEGESSVAPENEEGKQSEDIKSEAGEGTSEAPLNDSVSSTHKPSLDSTHPPPPPRVPNSRLPITCQISGQGITTALCQEDHLQSSINLDGLPISHLRISSSRSDGAWFASAATAYGTTSQTILWNYKIPDDILSFSRKETVPCGILVLLNVVDDSETPEWATKHSDDHAANLDKFSRRHKEQMAAMQAEARLPPAQKAQAARERMMRENEVRMQDMRDKLRLDNQRKETRVTEAFQSPKWDTKRVAEHHLAWLKSKRDVILPNTDLKEVVGTLLHRMVLDGEFSGKLCRMLDLWKSWAENGGMRKSDLAAVQEDQVTFAYATLLVAMIRDTTTAAEGTISLDLQECLRMWRVVRLG